MLQQGDQVKLTTYFKDMLNANDCADHIKEFGECIGTVEELVDYGTRLGPEVNVRWQPIGLSYAYCPYQDLTKILI